MKILNDKRICVNSRKRGNTVRYKMAGFSYYLCLISLCVVLTTASCDLSPDDRKGKLPGGTIITTPQPAGKLLGKGLLHVDPHSRLPVFLARNDELPFDTIIPLKMANGQLSFKTEKLGRGFQPYLLFEGSSDLEGKRLQQTGLITFSPQLCFRVISDSAHVYEIVLNEDNGSRGFVKLDAAKAYEKLMAGKDFFFDPNLLEIYEEGWYFYETWEFALKRAFMVELPDTARFYDRPNGKHIEVEEALLRVDSVQGDWARFRSLYYDSKLAGWQKWRDGETLLVRITLNGGYE